MFILIVQQLAIMFIIMIIGFVSFKTKLLNQTANQVFSTFLLMVVTPALIIYVFQIDFVMETAILLLYAFGAAVASHIFGIIVTNLFIRPKNNPEYVVERLSAVYSNCAFMGIPLVNATIGSEGVFFLSAYITVFNLLIWTHGVGLLKGNFSMKCLKEGLLSPVFITTIVAIVLYVTGIRLPTLVVNSLDMVAITVTPLSMMVAGISLAQADLKAIFTKFYVYKIAFFRLLIIPFLTLGLLALLDLEQQVAYTILIASACPTATAAVLMAIRYEKNHIHASKLFASGTVLGVITIPFVIFIADFIL
jgi:predicted permease